MSFPQSLHKALTELIAAGVDRSAEKLAAMSRARWTVRATSVKVWPDGALESAMAEPAGEHVGIYFTVSHGIVLVLLSKEGGGAVANAFLTKSDPWIKVFSGLEERVLAEVANVVANSVTGALADVCDEAMVLSPPRIVYGTRKQVFSEVSGRFRRAMDEEFMIMSHIDLSSPSLSADCAIVLLLSPILIEILGNALSRSER